MGMPQDRERTLRYVRKEIDGFFETGDLSLRGIFDWATRKGNLSKLASIHFDEDGKPVKTRYRQYRKDAIFCGQKLSGAFKGLDEGAVVALKFKNSKNWPLLFWGILMSGHPILLLPAKLPSENVNNLLRQGKAQAIVTNDVEKYVVPSFRLNDIMKAESQPLTGKWADQALFCSSGTTGEAKIMVMDGRGLSGQIKGAYDMPKSVLTIIHEGKIRNLGMIPLHHIFGFVAVFLWYTFFAKTIVYPDSMGTRDLLYAIRKGKCTNVYSVPLLWDGIRESFQRALTLKGEKAISLAEKSIAFKNGEITKKEAGFASFPLVNRLLRKKVLGTKVVCSISGGGYLSHETSRIVNGLGYELHNGYGMTEVGVTSVDLSSDVNERLKCSIGRALYGMEYKLKNQGENGDGELWIKTPALHVKEIIGGVERETETDEDGFFPSGDIASIGEDKLVYIKGRLKDVIISSNGENVYPDEIEFYFKGLPHVRNLVAFGAKKGFEERIILALELDDSLDERGLEALLRTLKDINGQLESEKRVHHFRLYSAPMPLTSSMKVKRGTLKKEYESQSPLFKRLSGETPQGPSLDGFPAEIVRDYLSRVRKVFAKNLLLPEFKIGDDDVWTTNLGGDSMSYVTMVSDLDEEFKTRIPEALYGKIGTVKGFAHELLLLKEGEMDGK